MSDVATFAPLVAGSHTARFSALALSTFQTGTDPYGQPLDVNGGGITFDATADVWASGEITVSAAWPGPNDETITVFGGEVYLARGVDIGAGGIAWAPMGYFRVTATAQDNAPNGLIRLTLDDRMMTIIESRLISPRFYAPGTTVAAVVDDLAGEVYPGLVVEYDSGSGAETLGRQITAEENRYEALVDIADGLGQIIYFDERGILRFADVPDATEPVWTIKAGADGVQVNANRSLTRIGVYNAVVARGEGMDDIPPVQAIAYDASPTSPTRWGGPFGMIPMFYASPFITTVTQARNAAIARLRRVLGAPYTVSLSVIPNPALRPYDPIRVVYADGSREVHIVEKYSIPYDVTTAAGIDTREQSVTYVRVE